MLSSILISNIFLIVAIFGFSGVAQTTPRNWAFLTWHMKSCQPYLGKKNG